jgi:hypothetical protein
VELKTSLVTHTENAMPTDSFTPANSPAPAPATHSAPAASAAPAKPAPALDMYGIPMGRMNHDSRGLPYFSGTGTSPWNPRRYAYPGFVRF